MVRRLIYIHDPMCSWCWAFNDVWQTIKRGLPADIELHYLVGGLAPDSDALMSLDMQRSIRGHWQRIQKLLPETVFNYDFWHDCQPRRSTYPACRALIAARMQGEPAEQAMLLAIQQAYYLQAKNPSDDAVLVACAESIGLNVSAFYEALGSEQVQQQLASELEFVQSLGVSSFPSLVLEQAGKTQLLNYDYNNAEVLLSQLR